MACCAVAAWLLGVLACGIVRPFSRARPDIWAPPPRWVPERAEFSEH